MAARQDAVNRAHCPHLLNAATNICAHVSPHAHFHGFRQLEWTGALLAKFTLCHWPRRHHQTLSDHVSSHPVASPVITPHHLTHCTGAHRGRRVFRLRQRQLLRVSAGGCACCSNRCLAVYRVVLVMLCLFHNQSSTTVSQLKSQHLQLPCLICNRLRAGIFSKATSCRPKSTRTCSLRLISFMFCFFARFLSITS